MDWNVASTVAGWGYFLLWSLAYYPQAILNYKTQSVKGMSLDCLALSVCGEKVQYQYRLKNSNQDSTVRLNDVFFAGHALILTLVTAYQTRIYSISRSQVISSSVWIFIGLSYIGTVMSIMASWWVEDIGVLETLYFLSLVNLFATVIKYIPQAYMNWERKSTVGWSIEAVLLDLGGGILSVAQIFIDSLFIGGSWEGIVGNPVKIGLGLISIGFDFIFLFQHYILYPERKEVRYEDLVESPVQLKSL